MPQGVERRIVVLRLDADRDSMKPINKPQGGKGLVFLSNDASIKCLRRLDSSVPFVPAPARRLRRLFDSV